MIMMTLRRFIFRNAGATVEIAKMLAADPKARSVINVGPVSPLQYALHDTYFVTDVDQRLDLDLDELLEDIGTKEEMLQVIAIMLEVGADVTLCEYPRDDPEWPSVKRLMDKWAIKYPLWKFSKLMFERPEWKVCQQRQADGKPMPQATLNSSEPILQRVYNTRTDPLIAGLVYAWL